MSKIKHGGVRVGTGSKPDYPGVKTQRISELLLVSLVRRLDELAAHQKTKRRQLLVKMITTALEIEGF